ncbi:MAG: hypothetical protein JRN23_00420 [Nitrososphaerota archaeon]|nr:hypothetical protein [Nitrososphaerota archaeon]
MRTERIQDGVERIVFVAGYPAVDYVQNVDLTVEQISSMLGVQRENVVKVVSGMKQGLEDHAKRERLLGEKLIEASVPKILASATTVEGPKGRAMIYVSADPDMSDELIVSRGEKLVKAEPSLVEVSFSPRGASTRLVCFVGAKAKESGVAADALVRELAKVLGGSGGGSRDFAQGGGPKPIEEAAARETVARSVSTMLGKQE